VKEEPAGKDTSSSKGEDSSSSSKAEDTSSSKAKDTSSSKGKDTSSSKGGGGGGANLPATQVGSRHPSRLAGLRG
jgi:hypothetical protein